MEIEVYRVSQARQVPDGLFWALDGEDTRFICAFDHYPDTLQYYEHRGAVRREPGQLLPFPGSPEDG